MKKGLLILLCLPMIGFGQQPINDGYLDEFFISSIDSITEQPIYTMHKVDRRGIFGNAKEMRKKVIRKANEFAAKNRMNLEEVSYDIHPIGILGDWATFTYAFKLVAINQKESNIKKSKDNSKENAINELKKLKELLDLDLITQEEYDKKAKELKQIILN
jgi:hypothetical protein